MPARRFPVYEIVAWVIAIGEGTERPLRPSRLLNALIYIFSAGISAVWWLIYVNRTSLRKQTNGNFDRLHLVILNARLGSQRAIIGTIDRPFLGRYPSCATMDIF